AHHQAKQYRAPGELSHLHPFGYEGLELRLLFERRHESLDLTLSLRVLPSTVFPASLACTAFITKPICFCDEAPVSVMAAAMAETGASSQKQMGLVMKAVQAKLAGKTVDGKTLSDKVRSKLS